MDAIQKKIDTLQNVNTSSDYRGWQKQTLSTLSNIYNESDFGFVALGEIQPVLSVAGMSLDKLEEAKEEANTILVGLMNDIQDFGLPKSNEKKGVPQNIFY